jgi:hypothetical protein
MGGAAIELRYQLTSPEKATLMARTNAAAYLVDLDTGTRILVGPPRPARGPGGRPRTRSSALMMPQTDGFPPAVVRERVPGQTFGILVPNPGGIFKAGSRVALYVGELRLDNLTIQPQQP